MQACSYAGCTGGKLDLVFVTCVCCSHQGYGRPGLSGTLGEVLAIQGKMQGIPPWLGRLGW